MTSKNLYFNLMRENFKRRIWPAALSMIVFFFSFPVAISMSLSNYTNYYHENPTYIPDYAMITNSVFGKTSVFPVVITCIFSVIFAIQGFGYLFSKSKVDLYHSMPVKREKLFITTFINGILVYFVPYFINLFLAFIITACYGVLSMEMVGIGIATMFINLVFYFLIYSTIVMVVMLTGNLVVSLLGSAVFLFYGPLLFVILRGYISTYFYSYHYKSGIGMESFNQYLSPLFAYIYTFSSRSNTYLYRSYSYTSSNTFVPSTIIGALAVGVIFTAISIFLYKKRPSEMAGKSIVFAVTKPVIKILLMILLVLGSALFFTSANRVNGADGWLIFGVVVGLVISHCLIEIIYEFDLKAVKNNLKYISIPVVLSAVIICFFRFDISGYDSYLPAKEKIESVSIDVAGYRDYFSNDYFIKDEEGKLKYFGKEEYILNNMKLTDIDMVYPLLEAGVKENKVRKSNGGTIAINNALDSPTNIPVKYVLKNGKEVYRNYYIMESEHYKEINNIYKSKEYKEGSYLLYSYSLDEISELRISYESGDSDYFEKEANQEDLKILNISKEEKKELFRVYMEELETLEYNDLIEDNSVGRIQILVEGKDERSIGTLHNPVLPKFSKTIELINRYTNR